MGCIVSSCLFFLVFQIAVLCCYYLLLSSFSPHMRERGLGRREATAFLQEATELDGFMLVCAKRFLGVEKVMFCLRCTDEDQNQKKISRIDKGGRGFLSEVSSRRIEILSCSCFHGQEAARTVPFFENIIPSLPSTA